MGAVGRQGAWWYGGFFPQLRAFLDANGNGCTYVDIDPKLCKRFNVDIRNTNTYVNEIRLLDGSLQLACTFPEGGNATADIKFESCD